MDEVKAPEKTSAWTDEERARDAAPTAKVPEIPPWVVEFAPGTVLTHAGWDCVVRHVGCEEGHWLILLEPMAYNGKSRNASRSEFRRLRAQVGKRKAKEILASRGQVVPVIQEELDAGTDD